MGFDFAQARVIARRAVHDTMRVSAQYRAPGQSTPTDLHVRWHHKMGLSGDVDNAGYAQLMVGVETIVLDKDELAEKGVVPERGATVTLGDGTVLSLDAKHPGDGPVKVVWSVSVG
jgi:hypothetical protein